MSTTTRACKTHKNRDKCVAAETCQWAVGKKLEYCRNMPKGYEHKTFLTDDTTGRLYYHVVVRSGKNKGKKRKRFVTDTQLRAMGLEMLIKPKKKAVVAKKAKKAVSCDASLRELRKLATARKLSGRSKLRTKTALCKALGL